MGQSAYLSSARPHETRKQQKEKVAPPNDVHTLTPQRKQMAWTWSEDGVNTSESPLLAGAPHAFGYPGTQEPRVHQWEHMRVGETDVKGFRRVITSFLLIGT